MAKKKKKKRKNQLSIDFKGFEEYYEKLDELGSNLEKMTEKALQASYEVMTPRIEDAIQPHSVKYTGDTKESLVKNSKVKWDGVTAYIPVGFNIPEGGLPSIFLMYGTPKMTPDKKLYYSFYGHLTKNKIKKIQKEIFDEELRKAMR